MRAARQAHDCNAGINKCRLARVYTPFHPFSRVKRERKLPVRAVARAISPWLDSPLALEPLNNNSGRKEADCDATGSHFRVVDNKRLYDTSDCRRSCAINRGRTVPNRDRYYFDAFQFLKPYK